MADGAPGGSWASRGAALGAATGRRLGRVPLALACGAAGLAYGAILDFSTWVTFTGEHTLGQYVAISGAALPFNIAHAVGNVVFCLAFGPALVRALLRFRARFEVRWQAAPAGRGRRRDPRGARRVALARPAPRGGRRPRDGARRGLPRARAERRRRLRAGAAGALHAAVHRLGGDRPVGGRAPARADLARPHLGGRQPEPRRRRCAATGDVERTILALVAWAALAAALGRHRPGRPPAHARPRATGRSAGWSNLTSFGVLALRAAGDPASGRTRAPRRGLDRPPAEPRRRLRLLRRGAPSGIDDTAAAVQALVAAGRRSSGAVRRAAAFLARPEPRRRLRRSRRAPAPTPSPRRWAVQALVAAGRDPDRVRRGGSRTPLGYLRTLVGSDGAVRYSRTSRQTPVWVTAQALTALARRPLPVRPRGTR